MLRDENQTQIIVIPRDLKQRVVESARENERSISGEIRYAVTQHLRDQERAETK
jgi:hypothetical protein